jgi:uncharacterized membrane protein
VYYFGHPGFWAIFFGWMLPVLLIAVVAGIVFLAFAGERPPSAPDGYTSRQDAAVAAARYRYAQGQLSRDDYRRLMADLGVPLAGDPPPPPWPDAPAAPAAAEMPAAPAS